MARKATKKPAAQPEPVETTGNLAHDASSNQPPPDVQLSMMLDDLELEAENWLDDEPLSSQEQADQLTALVDAAKRLDADIEAARKAEKEPFLEAGRAVDAKYKPLGERAAKTVRKLKNKIGEWLTAVAADKARREREAEEERRAAERRLQEAHEEARRSSNLADDEKLAAAEDEAEKAKREAARVKKEKVVSSGGGSKVVLRKVWLVNIKDRRELLQHYLRSGRNDFKDELTELLYKFARRDVRTSGVRSLPGCSIWSEDQPV